MAKLLKEHFGVQIQFDIPTGGMAIWARFDPAINLSDLSRKAEKDGLYFSDGAIYRQASESMNGTRMGFASMNEEEIGEAVLKLKSLTI